MKRRAALCRCQVLCGRAAEAGGGPKHLHDEWKLAKQIHIPSRMHMLEKLIDKRLIHSRTAHSRCRSFQKPILQVLGSYIPEFRSANATVLNSDYCSDESARSYT